MSDEKKRFTSPIKCSHCQNNAPMEIVAGYSAVQEHSGEQGPDNDLYSWEDGWVYQLNKCPACDGVAFRRYYYHDAMDPSEVEFELLYPSGEKALRGLPPKIHSGYEAARKVRNIDANAYGVLLGRVLDSICEDRQATGDTLDKRLKNLADKGEIPAKLVNVAAGMRKLRNIGAHADLGELTTAELPVLDDLTRAILEYVYSAPQLAREVEERLARLKTKARRRTKTASK